MVAQANAGSPAHQHPGGRPRRLQVGWHAVAHGELAHLDEGSNRRRGTVPTDAPNSHPPRLSPPGRRRAPALAGPLTVVALTTVGLLVLALVVTMPGDSGGTWANAQPSTPAGPVAQLPADPPTVSEPHPGTTSAGPTSPGPKAAPPPAPPPAAAGPRTLPVAAAALMVINRSSGKCMGLSGEPGADGANVSQQPCSAAASHWSLQAVGDGYVRLTNRFSGNVLDLAGCGGADGANVQQWRWLDNACQRWQIGWTNGGYFRLVNKSSGKVLDLNGCQSADGTDIQQWSWLDSDCQKWRFQPAGAVVIVNAWTKKVIGAQGCSGTTGTDVRQWVWRDSACEKWTFSHVSNGHYQIRPMSVPDLCLVVAGGLAADGADIELGSCAGGNAEWRFDPLTDGTVRFYVRANGKTIDVADCRNADDVNVRQWSWIGVTCQHYDLRSV